MSTHAPEEEATTDARPAKMQRTRLLERTEDFVKGRMAGNDGSHDMQHIERVRALALTIAKKELTEEHDLLAVELAALLHDVDDHKYKKAKKGCPDAAAAPTAAQFLDAQEDCTGARRELVNKIIAGVGFKDELGGKVVVFPELACVQDADRMDAIGAIGIARTFTFGGKRDRALYDPEIPPETDLTQEVYTSSTRQTPTINHFHEKLLKLKGMMKTQTGRTMAESRHQYMLDFLEQFDCEVRGVK